MRFLWSILIAYTISSFSCKEVAPSVPEILEHTRIKVPISIRTENEKILKKPTFEEYAFQSRHNRVSKERKPYVPINSMTLQTLYKTENEPKKNKDDKPNTSDKAKKPWWAMLSSRKRKQHNTTTEPTQAVEIKDKTIELYPEYIHHKTPKIIRNISTNKLLTKQLNPKTKELLNLQDRIIVKSKIVNDNQGMTYIQRSTFQLENVTNETQLNVLEPNKLLNITANTKSINYSSAVTESIEFSGADTASSKSSKEDKTSIEPPTEDKLSIEPPTEDKLSIEPPTEDKASIESSTEDIVSIESLTESTTNIKSLKAQELRNTSMTNTISMVSNLNTPTTTTSVVSESQSVSLLQWLASQSKLTTEIAIITTDYKNSLSSIPTEVYETNKHTIQETTENQFHISTTLNPWNWWKPKGGIAEKETANTENTDYKDTVTIGNTIDLRENKEVLSNDTSSIERTTINYNDNTTQRNEQNKEELGSTLETSTSNDPDSDMDTTESDKGQNITLTYQQLLAHNSKLVDILQATLSLQADMLRRVVKFVFH